MNDLNTFSTSARHCPDKCTGAAGRQRSLTPPELAHMSIEACREICASRGRASICGYCGCVYIREESVTRRPGVLFGGWHSALYPRERTSVKSLDAR